VSPAIPAGKNALDRRRPRGEQRAYLARLLFAAFRQIALRRAFFDVEVRRVGGAGRHRMTDQHDVLAFAQQGPAGLRRLRLDGKDKQ
jgi:hypothetical protein